VEEGSSVPVLFRFEDPDVFVKRIIVRLIRIESLPGREDQFETDLWTSNPIPITQFIEETTVNVSIPPSLCPTFRADLVAVDYRLDFELRAIDNNLIVLEPVIWSLPLEMTCSIGDIIDDEIPMPTLPLGSIPRLGHPFNSPADLSPSALSAAEIDFVISASSIHPGSMKFSIFSAPDRPSISPT
jgi:hypothetical protein